MSVVISSGFQDIKLADDSQWSAGRKRFFEDIMTELQRADEEWCASLVIGRKLDEAAAYFTAQDCLITIVMPEGTATYDENTKEIRFADEDMWVCFVHEASHFMHMVVDGGKFISPSFEHLEPMVHAAFDGHRKSNTKYLEYEAGYRSLYYNEIYEMGPKELYFERNLQNMMHYVYVEGLEDFANAIRACKNNDEAKKVIESRSEDYKKAKSLVKKWSDLDKFRLSLPKDAAETPEEN